MDVTQFWQLIEASRADLSGDDPCGEQAEKLTAILLRLGADEIIQFDDIFSQFDAAAYRWDLWGAAYVINGGASDDGFTYFRWWLIAQGQSYYEVALEDVEKAGDKADEIDELGAECEEIGYCANTAHREKTGADIPYGKGGSGFPAEPSGAMWQEEELAELYPRLWAKFG